MQAIGIDVGSSYQESEKLFHGSLKNIMGTRFDILIIGKNRRESYGVWNEIVHELRRLDAVFNRFDENSEVSRINGQARITPMGVSSDMWDVLQNCRDYNMRTMGLFDITLNNFKDVVAIPETNSISFSRDHIRLDFGGYAKGYALFKIHTILLEEKVEHCFADFGNSSILGMGHHPYGDSWKVSVSNPYNPDATLGEITLQNQALSVSGNSPSYSGHIVRPGSQVTVDDRKVVSIVTQNPLDAEVLSTVFMVADNIEKDLLKKEFNIIQETEYSL